MAKILYKAKFEDKLPLGGIATGHITLGCDGSITSQAKTFFVIKAEKDGELFDARLLQSSLDEALPLPCLESSTANSYFPFTEICFSDPSFPADVKMLSFSPFIPLNDTDSGIPAVCFEFEITNKSDDRIDYSICLVTANVNKEAYNRMGCTDTGEAYIHLFGDGENSSNTCIATNGKNISFCEYVPSSNDFINNFTKNSTLYNMAKSPLSNEFSIGALCTHFSLGIGDVTKVNFCLSWYSPENEFSRNYYAQYFESSLECASYLFRQRDRLYSSCMEFSKCVLGATLEENTLENVNRDLFNFAERNYLRLEDGTLVTDTKEKFADFESFLYYPDILSQLFPHLDYSQTVQFYKTEQYEYAKHEDIILYVLKSYRKYMLSASTDELIEEWYYIAKCMEKLFGEDGNEKCKADKVLITSLLESATVMAEAVKDKKRHELYSDMLQGFPASQSAMGITKGFASINEITGFAYNAVEKHIGFYPKSDICPLDIGNTFRCFFCTPSGYGYVEEGIDYIEINLLHGSLTLRSFAVPRIPRLVQYGGRNWKFENKNLVAVLDSDLEITPQKKLTIFIDIKQ